MKICQVCYFFLSLCDVKPFTPNGKSQGNANSSSGVSSDKPNMSTGLLFGEGRVKTG